MAGPQEQVPLRSLELQATYSPDTCPDLVRELFEPLLSASVGYDRTTYTFTPAALSMASRGITGLVWNDGRMRLICHNEQDERVIDAIMAGEDAEKAASAVIESDPHWQELERQIREMTGLDLVAWLVSQDRLEVKIAFPKRADDAIFHRKTGVFTDAAGDVVVFSGSLNETPAGWTRNDEELSVYSSWRVPEYVDPRRAAFDRLWNNESDSSLVIPIPEAIHENMIRFAPKENPLEVARRKAEKQGWADFWTQVAQAMKNDPSTTLETTPVSLWPHQKSFWRRYARDAESPPRVLIADEVGLGKTVEAGILLKALANRGMLRRVLILTPATARWQWQSELRHKFNLRVPVLDRRGDLRLIHPDGEEGRLSDAAPWHRSDWVIASYDWMRVNARLLEEEGLRFDLVVFDEAHRARYIRHGANRKTSNQYLKLLSRLSELTDGLLLLTATPMQIDVSELWALLELLQPDNTWNEAAFSVFHDINRTNSLDEWGKMRDTWRADADDASPESIAEMARMPQSDVEALLSYIKSRNASIILRDMTHERRAVSMAMMRRTTSVKRRVSRYTRNLLREYAATGRLHESVPRRDVISTDITMTADERALYKAIDELVRRCYERDLEGKRNALGFVMTHFRSRLGSSVHALRKSLLSLKEHRLGVEDDEYQLDIDDLLQDEDGDLDDVDAMQSEAVEMVDEALALCDRVRGESKYGEFIERLAQLRGEGHQKVIVFSRFKDTQDWLRDQISQELPDVALAGLSGQGDWEADDRGAFVDVDRAEATQYIAEQDGAGILLCTETAAESLNLQFCSAVVNYDIPWNPMRLEQRIGRIDRIGQESPSVRVVNLFYKDTVEHDAYKAMEDRIEQFQANVGALQPILSANLSAIIRRGVVEGADVKDEVSSIAPMGFDLDDLAMSAADVVDAPPSVSMPTLETALERGMPDGYAVRSAGEQWWVVTAPSGQQVRVTTNLKRYEKAIGDVEFFGPGSRVFPV